MLQKYAKSAISAKTALSGTQTHPFAQKTSICDHNLKEKQTHDFMWRRRVPPPNFATSSRKSNHRKHLEPQLPADARATQLRHRRPQVLMRVHRGIVDLHLIVQVHN